MLHGINNRFLYAAILIECDFRDDIGKEKRITGTAFFVVVADQIYLVTNRHVMDLGFTSEKYRKFSLVRVSLWGRFSGDTFQGCELPVTSNKMILSKNELNDFVCVRSPRLITANTPQLKLDYTISEEMIATKEDFERDITVCDFVAFPGYPEWYDEVEKRPIFRGGTIASDPRFNYSYKRNMGDCVAYEAFSFDGSSGSPVFALQKGIKPGSGIRFLDYRPGRFVGINAGHLPSASASHSGISYFFKSSAILSAIQDAT